MTLVVTLAANGVWRWWHNRPPYGAQALAATAKLQLVSYEQAAAALPPSTSWPAMPCSHGVTLGCPPQVPV